MPQSPSRASELRRYWRANLWLVAGLLTIWAIVSIGLSIVWAESLNQLRIGGFPLGFWISQQGAIYTFVLLILVYAITMGRLDRKYHPEGKR